ncbi:MAG: M48 family metallopeptidase [Schwartzia sp.]|nr:M48 family metallopeptidase [Schwartzia sp. (in: firmicutes)]
MKLSFWRRKAAAVAAAILLSAAPVAPVAEAFSLGDIIAAGAGAAISYQQADQQMKYLDGDGRLEYFDELKKQYGVNDDPYLNSRLDAIMRSLTFAITEVDPSIQEKPYNYFINTDTSFNAFCTLGHNMSVNTGMFDLTANDDEIAVVLGHEMGHGQKDHPRKSLKGALNSQILGAIVAEGTGIGILGTFAANYANASHFTKPQEWEADNLSFDYITHSEYNPGACAAIWQRVMDQYGSNSKSFVGEIFSPSDHPSHQQRRDNYLKKLAEYSGDKVKLDLKGDTPVVKVNGKEFVVPAAAEGMSANERACFITGALAKAYHYGAQEIYAEDGTVWFGSHAIISPVDGEPAAEDLADRLNAIR